MSFGGSSNVSFGRASKYVIWSVNIVWSGVEICHLEGRKNMYCGRWDLYVIWSDVEIYHLARQNILCGTA